MGTHPLPRLAGQDHTPGVVPETLYAKTPDGVYIAYQVTGEGPVDVAWQSAFGGNVDVMWDTPVFGPLFREIASFA